MKTKQDTHSSNLTANLSARTTLSSTNRCLAGVISTILLACCTPFASADYYSAATYVRIADKAFRLLDTQMTMRQRQVVNALTFSDLPASERPLYLHAVSFYASFKIAAGEALSEIGLAANLPSPAGLPVLERS